MRILLTTDSFPPDCGGSGWSTYEVAKGLRARRHVVSILQPMTRLSAATSGAGRGRSNAWPQSGGSADERGPASEELGGVQGSPPFKQSAREYDGFTITEIPAPAPNVPYVRNYFKNERLYRALAPIISSVIAGEKIDIVHAQHVMTTPPSIAAARRQRRPVVCTVRDYWPVCYWSDLIYDASAPDLCPACTPGMMCRCVRPRAGALWPLALPMIPYMRQNLARKRAALADADAIIAVSSALARDLRARAPELADRRIEIIPNPIDFSTIDEQLPNLRLTRPLDHSYVLYAGKLAPNKGVGKLFEAIARGAIQLPLVLAGEGPDRGALEADAARRGLRTRFLGWVPREEVWRWMIHATMVAFPSHGPESLSRVLLEASALGVPVAAMDTGGTRDIIVPDRTGLLSTDVDGLARDLARLAADPALASRLARGAREHARDAFDSQTVIDKLEQLYRELL